MTLQVLLIGGVGLFMLAISFWGLTKHWPQAKTDYKIWRNSL